MSQRSAISTPETHTPEATEETLFDRTFRDSDGKIVIAQKPNLPLLVGLAATLFTLLITSGNTHRGLEVVAFGALFTWAWQELFQGVNYFRRSLGLIILLGMIAAKLHWLYFERVVLPGERLLFEALPGSDRLHSKDLMPLINSIDFIKKLLSRLD